MYHKMNICQQKSLIFGCYNLSFENYFETFNKQFYKYLSVSIIKSLNLVSVSLHIHYLSNKLLLLDLSQVGRYARFT